MCDDAPLDTVHRFARGAESGDGEWVMGAPSLAWGILGRQGQLVERRHAGRRGEEIQQLRRGGLGSAQPRWCGFCVH